MKTAIALRHLAFEDAGLLKPVLRDRGIALETVDVSRVDPGALAALDPDLLIVLGGPIGVGDEALYPFLAPEIALVRARLAADRPTLGVCLGAQIMARALGAAVTPGPVKEIGYAPALTLTEAGRKSPLGLVAETGGRVLHWHGDQMAAPPGCTVLASTPATPVQAFARGPRALGLQFHLEVEPAAIEAWLIGHAVELTGAGIDPTTVRADALTHGAAIADVGRRVFSAWLDGASV